ncbi:MAG: OmpA family protein [Bacteroidota bacterium]
MTALRKLSGLLYLAIFAFVFTGCNQKTTQGAIIGAAGGGAAGGLIGKEKGKSAVGFIVGAVVGGAAGALIGNYMDKQAKEIENEMEGVEVERVGEGILLTFDSGLLFGFDSAELNAATKSNLRELAGTLNEYGETNLLIEGHTDSKGADSYNQSLSEKRAKAVSDYLKIQGVSGSRLVVKGYGEDQPVADNDSEMGRQKNRRVEVAIVANEDLKEKAESGDLGE